MYKFIMKSKLKKYTELKEKISLRYTIIILSAFW